MRVTVIRDTASPHFAIMSRRAANMRPVMLLIARQIARQWRRSFATKMSPDGKRWAPRKGRASHPLMVKTSTLLNSLQTNATRNEASATATAPYAGFHHRGTRNMPQRRALGAPQTAMNQVLNWIVRGQRR